MPDIDETVFNICEKVEKATKYEGAQAVTLALTISAAKRARAAGATKEEFSEVCGVAWGLSVSG